MSDPITESIDRFAANILQKIVDVLESAYADGGRITVDVEGKTVELEDYTAVLAKFARDLRGGRA
jgi:DNA-binding ferritin-like protein (Dps family)